MAFRCSWNFSCMLNTFPTYDIQTLKKEHYNYTFQIFRINIWLFCYIPYDRENKLKPSSHNSWATIPITKQSRQAFMLLSHCFYWISDKAYQILCRYFWLNFRSEDRSSWAKAWKIDKVSRQFWKECIWIKIKGEIIAYAFLDGNANDLL